ncbi:MAG: mechanosensitive ion channel, partial [Thermoguttaceae bacterium]|nr:mechanosensitive ion channel [Thermoguttaceae bacterium]
IAVAVILIGFFGLWDDGSAAEESQSRRVELVAQASVPENRLPKDTIVPTEAKKSVETKSHVVSSDKTPPKDPKPSSKAATDTNAASNTDALAQSETELDAKAIRSLRQMTDPKSMVKFFLQATHDQDYTDAVLALDFSLLPELTYIEKQNYAYKLYNILCRLDDFSTAAMPDEFSESECCLWPDKDYNAIVLVRHEDGTWRFGPNTVADIPRFFKQIENKVPVFTQQSWLRYFPDWMFHEAFDLAVVQWLILGLFGLAGFVVYRLAPVIFSSVILFVMRFSSVDQSYSQLLRRALRPLADFAMVYIWYLGVTYVQVAPSVIHAAKLIMQPFCVVIMMISMLRFVDIFKAWFRTRLKDSTNKVKNVLVDLSCGVLKCAIICTGCIGIAQIFGFSAVGIVSGMGIGGIAVALAAQQTIANFFGSLTILMDHPFTVGDYIVVNAIEGKVETVGLRSTKIRTFYDSMVFIPNNQLASSTIDNMGHRCFRRYKTTLGLQYDTPVSLLRAFCDGVRRLVEEHPRTRKDDIRVSVHDLGSSAIEIELICYFIVPDINDENQCRESLIMDMLSLAETLGVSFAFPSQTTYMVPAGTTQYPVAEQLKTKEIASGFGRQCADEILRSGETTRLVSVKMEPQEIPLAKAG